MRFEMHTPKEDISTERESECQGEPVKSKFQEKKTRAKYVSVQGM